MDRDTLVLDLETKKSFAEVGGKQNIRELGISVAGVYSYQEDAFLTFEEREIPKLEERLKASPHLVGFALKQFDLLVLEPYLKEVSLGKLAVTDIFEDALKFLGHRIGLEGLARATLKESKSGHGLEALEWYKQGKIEEIKKYCLDDVRLTRDLYEYGKKHGHVLFESYIDGKVHSIPVSWSDTPRLPVASLLEEAFQKRRRLAIEYVSSEDADGLGYKKSREIDIYKIAPREIEAYCHLRKALRKFRVDRIMKAEILPESYAVPQDVQISLFS